MVGICLVIIILGVAFAVDTGRTALTAAESRTIADLAALDAARSLDGRTASAQLATITQAARASATRNGSKVDDRLDVHLGVAGGTRPDGTVEYRRLNMAVPADAATVPNAVEIIAGARVPFYFAEGEANPRRPAVAMMAGTSSGVARISIATQVAEVNTGKSVLNGLLGTLGIGIDLDAGQYGSLASTNVSLLGVMERLDAPTGLIDETLNQTYSLSTLLGAIVAEAGNNPALAVLHQIALLPAAQCLDAGLPTESGACVKPGDFIDGSLEGLPLQGVDISALDFVRAMLMSGTIGETLDLALDLNIAGLSQVQVEAELTAPPKLAIGGVGTTVSSAQVTLKITPSVLPAATPALLSLPFFAVAGGGSATITGINCDGGTVPSSVTYRAHTRGARFGVGTLGKSVPPNPITDPVASAPIFDISVVLLGSIGLNAIMDVKAAESTVAGLVATPQLVGSPPQPAYPGTPVDVGFGVNSSRLANATQSTLGAAFHIVPRTTVGLLQLLLDTALGLVNPIVSGVVIPLLNPVLTSVVTPVFAALGATVGSAAVGISDAKCSARQAQLVLIQ